MASSAPAATAAAHVLLQRGAEFLSGAFAERVTTGSDDRAGVRARVLGNGLREMDLFLRNLLAAVVPPSAGPAPPPRNTARSFRLAADRLNLAECPAARLQALGRSRNCLYHEHGIVGRADADDPTSMAIGWWDARADGPALRRVGIGTRITLNRDDVVDVACFYGSLGDALIARQHGA